MNKKDATAFLGVTSKTIERYANAGRLTVRKVKGVSGLIADYDEAELKRIKKEIDPTFEDETDSDRHTSQIVATTGEDIVVSRPSYQ
jgi:hypothetical protein